MGKIIIPYTPRYGEVHAAFESARFCVLVAHRRFGKTVLAVNHLIKSAMRCALRQGHFGYVAPFRTQAKSVAWDYLKHYTGKVPGRRVNESELSVWLPSAGGGARVRIFGADNPDALRGLYFDGVVLDEVAQMKPQVWEEIIQPALADRRGFAVFIGTPKGINLFSELYYHALKEEGKGNADWRALRFPVDETRALPREEVERLRDELSDNKFRQEMLCDFTASADDVLISLDDARGAIERPVDPEVIRQWPLVVGVDVARFGEDATVFFGRRGRKAYEPVILRKMSNVEIAGRLVEHIRELRPAIVNIDQGQGTGVIDLARDLARDIGCVINEVPFGGKAIADDKFVNRRAEMWTSLRDWLKGGGSLSAGHADLLAAELTAPIYSFDSSGRIKLEAKDEIRKRLKRSTDLGDALALTFAVQVGPNEFEREYRGRARRDKRRVYDPFA